MNEYLITFKLTIKELDGKNLTVFRLNNYYEKRGITAINVKDATDQALALGKKLGEEQKATVRIHDMQRIG